MTRLDDVEIEGNNWKLEGEDMSYLVGSAVSAQYANTITHNSNTY